MKWNESGFTPLLCTYRLNWAPEDGEITLPSRHMICNSNPGGLRPSTLTLGHNTEFYKWMGKKYFCFFQTDATGNRTPNSSVKGSGANHHPRSPALSVFKRFCWKIIFSFGKKTEKNKINVSTLLCDLVKVYYFGVVCKKMTNTILQSRVYALSGFTPPKICDNVNMW